MKDGRSDRSIELEAEGKAALAEFVHANPDYAAPKLPWEGVANCARARRAAGLPLTERDTEALRRHPDPRPSTWPLISSSVAREDPERFAAAIAAGARTP